MQHPLPLQVLPLSAEFVERLASIDREGGEGYWNSEDFTNAMASDFRSSVLVSDGVAIGWSIARKTGGTAHLYNLTIAPAYRGLGLCRFMLDELTCWAHEQNIPCVWLEVRAGNTRAIDIYLRYGFAAVGSRRLYYNRPDGSWEDGILMSCKSRRVQCP
ncbi:MAG: GNAT family N-acetyltransferase [Comamonadaceae bacterium]|nr:MAG: GNAT family N-acetyltransferase [Comamonadaceae bacterium]